MKSQFPYYQRSNKPIILICEFHKQSWLSDYLKNKSSYLKTVRTNNGFAHVLRTSDFALSKLDRRGDTTPADYQISVMVHSESGLWAKIADADRQVYELRYDGIAHPIGHLTSARGDNWDYKDNLGKWRVSK
jgi:hypothetical protein